ncbi:MULTISPECIES: hypothetical protein, partial [Pseudomonas]|uniref:hypothetical protein n=1 Tax=Pseudomonas TaxID=286 RepID=UPI001EF020F3
TSKTTASLKKGADGGKLELRRVFAHEKAPGVGWVSNFWGALQTAIAGKPAPTRVLRHDFAAPPGSGH